MAISSQQCIIVGLLHLLLFTSAMCSAAPSMCSPLCNSWQTNTTARKVYSGLKMMWEMGSTLPTGTPTPTINANTELQFVQNLVCFTYDSYKTFSSMLLDYHPDHPQHANISGLQFVSWKTLIHSCHWLLNMTTTAAPDCTITGVSQFCLAHRFQLLWQQFIYNYPIPASSCYQNWLNGSFPPPSASEAVLNKIGCEEASGAYCCSDPLLELVG